MHLIELTFHASRGECQVISLLKKGKHDYRSIVGQLAWQARDTMPQLPYAVSDLHQNVDIATIGDVIHAKHVLCLAKKLVAAGHKWQVLHLDNALCLGVSLTKKQDTGRHTVTLNIYHWEWPLFMMHLSCVSQVKLLNQPMLSYGPLHISSMAQQRHASLVGAPPKTHNEIQSTLAC